MRILITRPLRESEATAARLAERGHQAVIAPVMRIVATDAVLPPGHFDAVLATSAHAIALLTENATNCLRELRVHVVGARAIAAAHMRELHNTPAQYADVAELTAAVLAQATPRSHFLYLAGRDRKPDLEKNLIAGNHHVEIAVIYEARAETTLPDVAVAALRTGKIDAVLHYSRRSAALFLELARKAGAGDALAWMNHVCISQDAAAPLIEARLKVLIAATPDNAGMFAALETA